jgi:hypothetical protein
VGGDSATLREVQGNLQDFRGVDGLRPEDWLTERA